MTDDADSQSRERVGTVLNDKWTLERLIGVGGMAAVYAARHRNGARAAVKVLHPDLSRHKEVRERFQREGYAANRVEHPGVVKVMDDDVIATGPDAGTAYLVMELLEGESLQDRLERGPGMGEREFLRIAASVLEVLEAAHARGVVHRDLKPENLFLSSNSGTAPGRVKVLDFGLARLLDGQTITSYGLALGTPSFMSPEQAAGRIDEIDGRTDLFALAATGFRLRTGRRIHEAANAIELVRKMASFAAPKIQMMAPDVSDPFARVIDRALEFRRDDRYESAGAMREDVQRAIEQLDGGARTELAVSSPMSSLPSPPPVFLGAEPTVELSGSDIQVTEAPRVARASAVRHAADVPPAAPPHEPNPPPEPDGLPIVPSVRASRRYKVILPSLALLLFVGVGVRLWLDVRKTKAQRAAPAAASAPPSAVPSESASASPSASTEPAAVPDQVASAAASGSAMEIALMPAPPAAPTGAPTAKSSPQPTAPHHLSPVKPGPGSVHHFVEPHHHRRHKTKARSK